MGKDQFGDSDKSRRIPKETIERAKEKPPAETKKPEKTEKD